jgi:hypothetical protein
MRSMHRDSEILTVLDAIVMWICSTIYPNSLHDHMHTRWRQQESLGRVLVCVMDLTSSLMHTSMISVPILLFLSCAISENKYTIFTLTQMSLYCQVFCCALSIPPAYTHMPMHYRQRWVCSCPIPCLLAPKNSDKHGLILSPSAAHPLWGSHVYTMLFHGRMDRMTKHFYIRPLRVVVGWVIDCLLQVMLSALQKTWRYSKIRLKVRFLVCSHLVHNTRTTEVGLIS